MGPDVRVNNYLDIDMDVLQYYTNIALLKGRPIFNIHLQEKNYNKVKIFFGL